MNVLLAGADRTRLVQQTLQRRHGADPERAVVELLDPVEVERLKVDDHHGFGRRTRSG